MGSIPIGSLYGEVLKSRSCLQQGRFLFHLKNDLLLTIIYLTRQPEDRSDLSVPVNQVTKK